MNHPTDAPEPEIPPTPGPAKPDRTLPILLLLLSLALGVRLAAGMTQPPSHVGVYTLVFIGLEPDGPGEVVERTREFDVHPPLYYLLFYGLMQLFGPGMFAVRLFGALINVTAIWMVWRIGRRWFGPSIGWSAAALMGIAAYPVFLSVYLRMYGLLCLWTVLMLWFFLRIVVDGKTDGRLWAGYALVQLAAFYTQYLAIFVSATFNLLFLIHAIRTRPGWSWVARWATAQTATALLFLPWFLYTLTTHFASPGGATLHMFSTSENFLQLVETPFRYFFMGVRSWSPLLATVLALGIGGSYLFFLVWTVRTRSRPGACIILSLCVTYALIALYSLGVASVISFHYLVIAYPPAVLAVAGVARKKGILLVASLVAVQAILFVTHFGRDHNPYETVVKVYREHAKPGDAVVFDAMHESAQGFLYYTRYRNLAPEPEHQYLLYPSAYNPELSSVSPSDWPELLDRHGRVWLVGLKYVEQPFTQAAVKHVRSRYRVREFDVGNALLLRVEKR